MTRNEADRFIELSFTREDFRRATFAGTQRGPAKNAWVRVSIRPIELRGVRCLQWSYFDGRKTDIQNYALHEIATPLSGLLNVAFAGIHLDFATESIDNRTTKKGQISLGRKKSETTRELDLTHNRVKDLPLPEGRADRLLEVMGIATPDGQVKPTRRAKFNQVNEFLKQLRMRLPTRTWLSWVVRSKSSIVGAGRVISLWPPIIT